MTREEAIKDIEENILPIVGGKSLRMAIDALRQPERKKGMWINIRHDNIAECDQCGITGRAWMNFCFNCGAEMTDDNI